MKKKLLTAATILATCAGSSWSQATETRVPSWSETSIESSPSASDFSHLPISGQLAASSYENDYSSFRGIGNTPARNAWLRAEFLMWAIKDGESPPLVQSEGDGGELTTLFGGDLNHGLRLGGRFTVGTWLDSCQNHGIEASYFFLDGQSDGFNGFSSGLDDGTWLFRPYLDVNGDPQQQLLYLPGVADGTIDITSWSQFQGGEVNILSSLCRSRPACDACDSCDSMCGPRSGHRWDLITGFRYMNLGENLSINENLTYIVDGPPLFPNGPLLYEAGDSIAVSDNFATRNNFYGGQIGLRHQWWRDRWFVDVSGKVALGTTHQQVRINGSTVFTLPGDPNSPYTEEGGLLALTNIGTYSRNRFATVPEVGISVGRQLTDHCRASVGYNFIYWSNVVRPGNQFDLIVDETQLPEAGGGFTPDSEPFAFRSTDFWAQGISFGLEYAW